MHTRGSIIGKHNRTMDFKGKIVLVGAGAIAKLGPELLHQLKNLGLTVQDIATTKPVIVIEPEPSPIQQVQVYNPNIFEPSSPLESLEKNHRKYKKRRRR